MRPAHLQTRNQDNSKQIKTIDSRPAPLLCLPLYADNTGEGDPNEDPNVNVDEFGFPLGLSPSPLRGDGDASERLKEFVVFGVGNGLCG